MKLEQSGYIKISPQLNSQEFNFLKIFIEKLHYFYDENHEVLDPYAMVQLPYSDIMKRDNVKGFFNSFKKKPTYAYAWTGLKLMTPDKIILNTDKFQTQQIDNCLTFLYDNFLKKNCLFNHLRAVYTEENIIKILEQQNENLKKISPDSYQENQLIAHTKKLKLMMDVDFKEHDLTNTLFYKEQLYLKTACVVVIHAEDFKKHIKDNIEEIVKNIQENSDFIKKNYDDSFFEKNFLNHLYHYFYQDIHYKKNDFKDFIVGHTKENLCLMLDSLPQSLRIIKIPLSIEEDIHEHNGFDDVIYKVKKNYFNQHIGYMENQKKDIYQNKYLGLSLEELKKQNIRDIFPINIILLIFDLCLEDMYEKNNYKKQHEFFGNHYLKKQNIPIAIKNMIDFNQIIEQVDELSEITIKTRKFSKI